MHLLKTGIVALSVALAAITVPAISGTVEIVIKSSQMLEKGNRELKLGDPEKAEYYFARALDSNLSRNARPKALNGMCVAKIMLEEWEVAIEHCNEAINLRKDWRFYNNRGNAFFGMGQFEEALLSYQKALKIKPSSDILKRNRMLTELQIAKQETMTKTEEGAIGQL